MVSRRSHRKSRNGCFTCKQRRVKCDETGPPCGNCKARSTSCRYASPGSGSQGSPTSNSEMIPYIKSSFDYPQTAFPQSHQLLELRLMHRWSTVTYRSMSSSVAKDYNTWQNTVSDMAQHYDFLLHGIFAISAFDLARTSDCNSSEYVSTALEYQNLAIQSFQAQLSTFMHDSVEASMYFSMILIVLSFASAQFVLPTCGLDSMIHNSMVHYELIQGTYMIMKENIEYWAKHPLFCRLDPITKLQKTRIAAPLDRAFKQLDTLNTRRHITDQKHSTEYGLGANMHQESCQKALFWLRETFETCDKSGYRDYSLGWPSLAGKEYMEAVKDKDTVALLILMYWGIFVERLSQDYWWACGFGKSLVNEIAETISLDTDATMNEVVLWACSQVCADANSSKNIAGLVHSQLSMNAFSDVDERILRCR